MTTQYNIEEIREALMDAVTSGHSYREIQGVSFERLKSFKSGTDTDKRRERDAAVYVQSLIDILLSED